MPLEGAALRNAVKFTEILKNTETYSPSQMQAYQRRLLERLVRHAKAEVPFYETRLNPLFGPNDEIRWEAWEEVTIFSRAEAQDAGKALFARNTPSQVGNYVTKTTSGSTAMPLMVRISALTGIMSAALNQRIFDWHSINTDASFAFILWVEDAEYPEGFTSNDWNLRNQNAIAHLLSINSTVRQQVEWLARKKPEILCTFPQNARAIVKEMLETKTPISFDTVFVLGEPLDQETKNLLEISGIRIIDRYGGEEIGSISASCPEGYGHHQFAEVGYIEVSSENAIEEVGFRRGPLIVTPFYNYAMPMIRYRNDDIIEMSNTPCPCGRTLPLISTILGRARNMFTFSDGSTVWPNMTYEEYKPFLPAKQFQVIQHTFQDIEVIYVASNETQPVDHAGLLALFREKFHSDIELKLNRVEALQRAPSGKFEAWKSLVKPD